MSDVLLHRRRLMAQANGGGVLPSGYRQVEFIENISDDFILLNLPSGITNAGYNNNLARLNIDYEVTIFEEKGGICGFSNDGYSLSSVVTKSSLNTYASIYNKTTESSSFTATSGRHIYTVTASSVFIDGNKVCSKATWQGMGFMSIFAVNLHLGNVLGTFGKGRCYHSWFDDDGNIVIDLYPCYRLSDNEPGLYDIINDIFYSKHIDPIRNYGTGDFILGPDTNEILGFNS